MIESLYQVSFDGSMNVLYIRVLFKIEEIVICLVEGEKWTVEFIVDVHEGDKVGV